MLVWCLNQLGMMGIEVTGGERNFLKNENENMHGIRDNVFFI